MASLRDSSCRMESGIWCSVRGVRTGLGAVRDMVSF